MDGWWESQFWYVIVVRNGGRAMWGVGGVGGSVG